jgi:hypothetical protein
MAFLNDYKCKAIRKTNEYQCIMEDLVRLGIVKEEDYNTLIGRDKSRGLPERNTDVKDDADIPSSDGISNTDKKAALAAQKAAALAESGLTDAQLQMIEIARETLSKKDKKKLDAMPWKERFDALVKAGLITEVDSGNESEPVDTSVEE